MSLRTCIAELRANGKIDDSRADRFLKLFEELETGYRRQFGEQTATSMASVKTIEALEAEALQNKRQQLLQLGAQRGIARAMREHVDNGGRADQFALSLFDHHENVRGVSAIDNRRVAVRQLAWSRMGDFLGTFRRDLLGRVRNPADLANMVRERFGTAMGDPAAKELADAFGDTAEYLRQRFNAAGGHIGKLEHWGLPQAHDHLAVAAAGFPNYRDFTVPLLHPERMVDQATGQPFTASALEEALQDVYETIASDGLSKLKPGQIVGSKLANRRADSRFLHFKDADAWLAYRERFGTGDPFNAIVGHIDGMARDIAAMEVLGPNPGLTVRWLGDVLKQDAAPTAARPAVGREVKRARNAARETQQMWEMYTGATMRPHDPQIARFFSGLRNWNVSAQLGGAAISAFATDPIFMATTAKFNGLDTTRMLAEYAKQLNPLDPTHRRIAERSGLVWNELTTRAEAMSRGTGMIPFNVHELTQRLSSGVLRVSGLSGHTTGAKGAFGLEFMMSMADRAGQKFDELDRPFGLALERYGIGPEGWEAARSTPLFESGGQKLLRPDELARRTDIDPRMADQLATKFLEMIDSETRLGIPGESLRASTKLASMTGVAGRRGTIPGELLHSMTQYKTYSVIALYTHLARSIYGQGGTGRAYYFTSLMSLLTIGGLAALTMKAIASGKDPPPLDDPRTWARAFVQGGGAGTAGDFVGAGFGGQSRTGGGVAGYIAGPTISNVVDPAQRLIFGIPGAIAGDNKTNVGREVDQLLERNLPGGNNWYTQLALKRLLLDRAREIADPNARHAWRQMERRSRRNFSQDYYWHPGETTPERAPQFGGE